MKSISTSKNVYHFNVALQILMIGLAVLLVLMSVLPILAQGYNAKSFNDFVLSLACFSPFAVLLLFYTFGCRLVVKDEGIISYYYFPFRMKISWESLVRIEKNYFGVVNLIYNSGTKQNVNTRNNERVITLSLFDYDGEKASLLKEIQEFAPHLTIPDEVRSNQKISLQYKTVILLLFYVLCIPLMLIFTPFQDQVTEQTERVLNLASFGLLGGILGGMMQLWRYQIWLNTQPSLENIKKTANLLYLTPFIGWLLALFFGIGYQLLLGDYAAEKISGSINLIALLLGLFAFQAMTKILLFFSRNG